MLLLRKAKFNGQAAGTRPPEQAGAPPAVWTAPTPTPIEAAMQDFWRDCGYHLLERRGPERGTGGHLVVTDDFLRAYLNRPEVRPVPESNDAERALHAALLRNPREAVSDERLAAMGDSDAIENYRVVLGFRERLLAAATVEDAYLQVFLEPGGVTVPPLFVDQLAHVIARAMLEGEADPRSEEHTSELQSLMRISYAV